MPTRTLLVRGIVAGFTAGAVAFVVAYFFGEPSVVAAMAVKDHAQFGDPSSVQALGRTVQSTAGLLIALMGFGASVGGLFGLAYAVCQGRLGDLGMRTSAAVIGLVGFVLTYLIPFVKYPANPPALGRADTLDQRNSLFFLMIILSVLAALVAARIVSRLDRLSAWDRTLSGIGVYLILVTICMTILPQLNEVEPGFPAAMLWEFRTGSFLTQLALWATLSLLYGGLTDRASRLSRKPRAGARTLSAR